MSQQTTLCCQSPRLERVTRPIHDRLRVLESCRSIEPLRFLALFVFVTLGCGQTHSTARTTLPSSGGSADLTLEHQGRSRSYRVYRPKQTEARPALLLNLHGRKGTAAEQETRLRDLADAAGYILVSPQGVGRSWNAGVGFGEAHAEGVDDVGFIAAILDALKPLDFDEDRVFATGFSNGARMVHRLGCELSDRITAIAPIAGPISNRQRGGGTAAYQCKPKRTVAVFTFHGGADSCTPLDGGDGADTKANISFGVSTEEWAHRNLCTSRETHHIGGTECVVQTQCRDGATVVGCTAATAGHVWPGGKKYPGWRFCGGQWPADFVLNDQLRTFFAAHGGSSSPSATWTPLGEIKALEPSAAASAPLSESDELPFDRSKIVVTAGGSSPRELTTGSYAPRSLKIAGALTLYSKLTISPGKISALRVLAQATLQSQSTGDFKGDEQPIYKASLGVTALYVPPNLNFYAVHGGVAFAESKDTINAPDLLPYIVGLGTHRHSPQFMWIYGGGYAHTFGFGIALPFGGFSYHPRASRFSFAVILPLLAYARFQASEKLQLNLQAAGAGDRFRFANDGLFPNQSDTLGFRAAQGKLSVGARYRMGRAWVVRINVGALTKARVEISDGNEEVATETARAVGFLSTSIELSWGRSPI